MQTVQIFCVEINGFNQTFESLGEVRSYVHGMKDRGYVKSGDNAVLHSGTRIKRATETTDKFEAGSSRTIPVA